MSMPTLKTGVKIPSLDVEPALFVVHGQPYSKANSRQFIRPGKIIKSAKALAYCDMFKLQCPWMDVPYTGDVTVSMEIYYASRRPDLDESLILDLLQGKIIANDRQIKMRHVKWGLDKDNPRAIILVQKFDPSVDIFKTSIS